MINFIGILLLYSGPLYIIIFNNSYNFYFELLTMIIYGTLLSFSMLYLIGALRCSIETAFQIQCENLANKSKQKYLHLGIVLILSSFMISKDYYYLIDYSLIILTMLAPILIHTTSKLIINYRVKPLYEIDT